MLPKELLTYLRERLENHSFSMSHEEKELLWSYDGSAKTDGKTIQIPKPSELTRKSLEFAYAMEIHETAHILYSSLDWEEINSFVKKHGMIPALAMSLWNQMEDYRVNALIAYSHPGSGMIMHRVHQRITEEQKKIPRTRPEECILLELEGHSYNKKFGKEGTEKLAKACTIARGVVGYTDGEKVMKEVLPKIYEIFKPEDSERDKDSERKEHHREFQEFAKPTKSKEEVKKETEKALEKKPKDEDNPYSRMDVESKSEEDGDKGKTGGDRESESGDKSVYGDEELKSEEEGIEKTLESAEKMLVELSKTSKEKEKLLREISKEVEEEDPKSRKVFQEVCPHQRPGIQYKDIIQRNKSSIQHMVKQSKKIFLFRRGYQSGHRIGKLNSRKSHRLVTNGDSRIFKRKTDNKNVGDIAIGILVDESGSMSDNKYLYAREATICLHEVFRKLRIKHMVVGYTADIDCASTENTIYRFWDDRGTSGNLVKINARCENRDGPSIRLATKSFRKVEAKRKILIVISDGYPQASGYRGLSAVEDTIESHKEAEKQGIKIINVGIGKGFELPSQYKNKVKVDSVSELSKSLMKVVAKEIM